MSRCREVAVTAAAIGALLATGCARTGAPGVAPSGAAPGSTASGPLPYPTAFSSGLLGPMGALGECPEVPDGDVAEPAGLLMPEGTVLQTSDQTGDLVQVLGYVPLTPVQLLDHFLHRDDISLITLEHEQFESETLYDNGDHRVFVKSQVACATGSNFVAVIADAAAASQVPIPSGAPSG